MRVSRSVGVEIRRDQMGNMSGTTKVKYVAALRLLYAALLKFLYLICRPLAI